jgi:hypothetical protein
MGAFMSLYRNSRRRGMAGTKHTYHTLVFMMAAACLMAGCALTSGKSTSTHVTSGSVPRDAWGNPILVSTAESEQPDAHN